MTEQDAAPILLVRSIEEVDPKTFPSAVLDDALTAAAGDLHPPSWFMTRARFLLNSVPHPYGSILRIAQLPDGWMLPICALVFCIGLGTNYLGSFAKIPILLNPIMALVAWNLLLYVGLLLWWLRSRIVNGRRLVPRSRDRTSKEEIGGAAMELSAPAAAAPPPWVARVLLPSLWVAVHNFTLRFHATRKQAVSFGHVARHFWSHWLAAAGPLLLARWRRLSHLAAIALALGAISGMYIRGIFLRYEVIWSSTFINDETTVAGWIAIIFAPAVWLSRLTGHNLGGQIDAARLMTPEGAPAAPWIHLFVLTALAVIIVPRALLAAVQSVSMQRARAGVRIDFDDYFGRLIRPQLEAMVGREIAGAVRAFAESIAAFVCEGVFDHRILPELVRFRTEGGKIEDLRQRIHQRCEESREEIHGFALARLHELEAAIAPALARALSTMREDFRVGAMLEGNALGEIEVFPEEEFDRSLRPIGTGLTDALGASVSASVAVAMGTLAGGFGESLEIAVAVALFGTTGPVGFLIGALIGLVAGAGTWWWGRERITERVEKLPLPGKLVATVLWQSRFDRLVQQSRERCLDTVRGRVQDVLSSLSARICSEAWSRLEQAWRKAPANHPAKH